MQDIVTYMIVGAAVAIVLLKLAKQFLPKKQKKINYGDTKIADQQHNCSDCSAECLLRDLPIQLTEKNTVVCKKVEEKSKLS